VPRQSNLSGEVDPCSDERDQPRHDKPGNQAGGASEERLPVSTGVVVARPPDKSGPYPKPGNCAKVQTAEPATIAAESAPAMSGDSITS
jgi:hypothetical protein